MHSDRFGIAKVVFVIEFQNFFPINLQFKTNTRVTYPSKTFLMASKSGRSPADSNTSAYIIIPSSSITNAALFDTPFK